MEEQPKFIKITFNKEQVNLEISNISNYEFALAIMNMQALLMKTLMGTMNVGTQASTAKDDSSYR